MKNYNLIYLLLSFLSISSSSFASQNEESTTTGDQMKPRILIIGGGIGGLAFANALKNHGIPFDLIEKRSEWTREGTGIALPANATWALQQLGFEHEIEECTAHIKAMTFTTDQDELLICEDITKIHNARAQFRSIHRADLHDILLSKIKNVGIRMGVSITGLFQEDKSEKVEVHFSDHTKAVYDLVVGADGIHSEVRKQLFGEDLPVYQGLVTWRMVIDTPEGLDHPQYMLGNDTVFLLYPLNNEKTYVYCHQVDPSRSIDIPENRVNKLRDLFGDYKGYVSYALSQIKDSNQVVPGWLESVPEIKWSKGNAILIGDASHACSPMLQQGGAQAIEDGWVLGEEIKLGLSRGESMNKILANFVSRRHERVSFIVQESDKKIKILPHIRNNFIKANGAPNVALFRVIMKETP